MDPCWNVFCIATDCDGEHHVDTTGATWNQKRGQAYCPVCRAYTADCGHHDDSVVTTIYERGGLTMLEIRRFRQQIESFEEPDDDDIDLSVFSIHGDPMAGLPLIAYPPPALTDRELN